MTPTRGIVGVVPVHLLAPDDWVRLREVRLRALADSPRSFLSTYADQVTWPDERWQAEAARGEWLVEFDRGHAVGLVGATAEYDISESERYLSYLWVAPTHRHCGVGGRLVRTLLARLQAAGVPRVWLWVIDGNPVATRLYEQIGFASTGDHQPLPDGSGREERRMSLAFANRSALVVDPAEHEDL